MALEQPSWQYPTFGATNTFTISAFCLSQRGCNVEEKVRAGRKKTFADFLPNFPNGSTSGTTDWAKPEENLNNGENYWEQKIVKEPFSWTYHLQTNREILPSKKNIYAYYWGVTFIPRIDVFGERKKFEGEVGG